MSIIYLGQGNAGQRQGEDSGELHDGYVIGG